MRTLLESDRLRRLCHEAPIEVVDVGARGGLGRPWSSLDPQMIRVIGFEPDETECNELNARSADNELYLPIALWSHETTVKVHVAEFAGCSSVHPPNEQLLARFAARHGRPRRTTSTASFPANTLDTVLKEHGLGCDFLKIDVQGSELEILQGASNVLRDEVSVVLVETWTSDVHLGQGLAGEVMSLLTRGGMTLFDVQVAAAWGRRTTDGGPRLCGKRQVVGLDLLFFREPLTTSTEKAVKAAAITEAFGFPDYALELLETVPSDVSAALASEIIRNGKARCGLRARLSQRIGRPLFAPLHE